MGSVVVLLAVTGALPSVGVAVLVVTEFVDVVVTGAVDVVDATLVEVFCCPFLVV